MQCTRCGMTDTVHRAKYRRTLDVHRITPGSLYTVEGCITRCKTCHASEPQREPGTPDLANGPRDPAVSFVLRPDILERVRHQAARWGMLVSDYTRYALVRKLEQDESTEPEPLKKGKR